MSETSIRRGPSPGAGPQPLNNPQGARALAASHTQKEAEARKQNLLRTTAPVKAPQPPPEPVKAPNLNVETIEEATSYAADTPLDSSWERAILPSGFIFYDWQDIHLRRFNPMDQAKLARAIRYKNITLVLDVIASTCNRDPRKMSAGDFQSVCVWHKLNSYLNTSVKLSWMSKYGNRCTVEVKRTEVTEKRLPFTRADYLELKAKGLAFPTMGDVETLEAAKLDEDQLYLFDKAQYLDTEALSGRIAELKAAGDRAPSITARLERLQSLTGPGLALFDDIMVFAAKYGDYGVFEKARVTDNVFKQADRVTYADFLSQSEDADDLNIAAQLLSDINEGKDSTPVQEEVPLTFNLWRMFPYT